MESKFGVGFGSYVEHLEQMPARYHNLGFAAYSARLVTEFFESVDERDEYYDVFLDIRQHLMSLGIDSDEHFTKFGVSPY